MTAFAEGQQDAEKYTHGTIAVTAQVDGKDVSDSVTMKVGDTMNIKVIRDKKTVNLNIVLEESK